VSEYSVGFLKHFVFLVNVSLMRYLLIGFRKIKKILWRLNYLTGYLLITVKNKELNETQDSKFLYVRNNEIFLPEKQL